jgi:hypothetical protein
MKITENNDLEHSKHDPIRYKNYPFVRNRFQKDNEFNNLATVLVHSKASFIVLQIH